jgi:WD40 repeat protein
MTSIFLSYARGDDKRFVRRLYQRLKNARFDVWFDRVSMPSRQLTFYQEIRDAIAASDRLVFVVGPDAIASEYVEQEWRFAYFEALKCVNPIVRLDGKDARGKSIDGYTLIPEDLRRVHAEDFRQDDEFEAHAENLIRQLSEALPPAGKLVAVPELPPHFVAEPYRINALRDMLLADLTKPVVVSGAAGRVGLQGMGGIGKSVLASALAHRPEVRRAFPDGVYWVTLGSEPRIEELQRSLLKELGDESIFTGIESGKQKLRNALARRAALLVLDNVWQRPHAEAFNVTGARGRLLLTTRDASLVTALASRANHYQVQLPTAAEAEALLAKAMGAEEPLPPEARRVIEQCGRLPLALALCGGMVWGGTSWRDLLEALREHDLEYLADDHALEEQHRDIWRAMDLSLRVLPENERDRFTELAVFALDTGAPDAAVETLWAHTAGLSPRAARDLLRKFHLRSLVRRTPSASDGGGRMSLHDLVHNFATGAASKRFGSLAPLHERLLDAYRKKCSSGWPSGPDDGYFFEHLRDHLIGAGKANQLVSLLLDLNWLEAKNEKGLTFDLPIDFSEAQRVAPPRHPQRHFLPLLEEALRRDIHFIYRHPTTLFQCLWNSCWWYDCPEIAKYRDTSTTSRSPRSVPPRRRRATLCGLLETWRDIRKRRTPELLWLQSVRPPEMHLGTAQVSVMRGHTGWVTCAVPSPDGRRFASASCDGSIRIWDAATGGELLCVPHAAKRVHEQQHGAPGRLSSPFGLLGMHPGMSLEEDEGSVNCLAYSRDSRHLVSGGDNCMVCIWDAETGAELRCLRGHRDYVNSVSFSSDSNRIVSASGGYGTENAILIWNAKTGGKLRRLSGHKSFVKSVTFSPDGSCILSASVDKTIRVWEVDSGKKVFSIRGHNNGLAAAFSPDGSCIVSGGHDRTIRIWEAKTGKHIRSLIGHEDTVNDVSYSPDSQRIVSAGHDRTIRIWDAATGRELRCLRGHEESVASIAYTPDGTRILSGSWDGTIRLWRAEGGEALRGLTGHRHNILCESFSPDGGCITTSSADGTIRVWDAGTGAPFLLLQGHEDTVQSVSYSREGRWLVSGSTDKTVRLWDAKNGEQVKCFRIGHRVYSVSLHPDARCIAIGTDTDFVLVWDIKNDRELLRLCGHERIYVNSVSYSPDGRHIVSGSSDQTVRIWDAVTGRELRCLRGHADKVRHVSYSSDGQRIASQANDDELRVWDSDTKKCLLRLKGYVDTIAAATGSPQFPYRLIVDGAETVVEDYVHARMVGWFPRSLDATHPSGEKWCGSSRGHLYLVKLQRV